MLIRTAKSIFELPTKTLVNPVNCVGVMGKGLALDFKERFPDNFNSYVEVCKNKDLRPGGIVAFKDGDTLVINLATKDHWRSGSQLEWIDKGLKNLASYIVRRDIKSIAVPALGCGLGGLDKDSVFELAIKHLESLDCKVYFSIK